jgi:hypothetical protein
LVNVIEEKGPSSETNGLLGRVYKDRWEDALKAGRNLEAQGLLRKAIETYLRGFEFDWRDAYPGVNAVTLMELDEPVDKRQSELVPVIRYSLKRRLQSKSPDYWDHATLLELSVLANDREAADKALADALASIRESWEPESTSRNLRLIREAREKRKQKCEWIGALESELNQAAGRKLGRT